MSSDTLKDLFKGVKNILISAGKTPDYIELVSAVIIANMLKDIYSIENTSIYAEKLDPSWESGLRILGVDIKSIKKEIGNVYYTLSFLKLNTSKIEKIEYSEEGSQVNIQLPNDVEPDTSSLKIEKSGDIFDLIIEIDSAEDIFSNILVDKFSIGKTIFEESKYKIEDPSGILHAIIRLGIELGYKFKKEELDSLTSQIQRLILTKQTNLKEYYESLYFLTKNGGAFDSTFYISDLKKVLLYSDLINSVRYGKSKVLNNASVYLSDVTAKGSEIIERGFDAIVYQSDYCCKKADTKLGINIFKYGENSEVYIFTDIDLKDILKDKEFEIHEGYTRIEYKSTDVVSELTKLLELELESDKDVLGVNSEDKSPEDIFSNKGDLLFNDEEDPFSYEDGGFGLDNSSSVLPNVNESNKVAEEKASDSDNIDNPIFSPVAGK